MSYQLNSRYPSRQVHLLSKNGQNLTSTDSSDLYFKFSEMLSDAPHGVDVVLSCVSATIPYSWQNISTALMNNTINYTCGYNVKNFQFVYSIEPAPYGTVFTRVITIPDGNYADFQALVSAIQNYNPVVTTDYLTFQNILGYVYISASVPIYGGTTTSILFFIFGIFAGLVKSNLEIPQPISRFLSLYLLMAC